MRTVGILGLAMGVLVLVGPAGAQVRTVVQTMDYADDSWSQGIWFAVPNNTPDTADIHLDTSPYYRTNIEDWKWTHDLTTVRPAAALGIESATLTITAWDVASLDEGEDFLIYIGGGTYFNEVFNAWLYDKTGVLLGLLKSFYDAPVTVPWPSTGQRTDYASRFSRTTFTIPPAQLDTLWNQNKLTFWIDIDQSDPNGNKVTLIDSSLSVRYIIPGPPADSLPVYRFWSSTLKGYPHFYTIDAAEKQSVIDNYPVDWTYEGIAYNALPVDTTVANARPVYRFWSPVFEGHFYTMNEAEKQSVIDELSFWWTFEGPAFAAFPEDSHPADTYPVHRFWSDSLAHHFYTMDEAEKQYVIENYAGIYTYEGIAWYAYVPSSE